MEIIISATSHLPQPPAKGQALLGVEPLGAGGLICGQSLWKERPSLGLWFLSVHWRSWSLQLKHSRIPKFQSNTPHRVDELTEAPAGADVPKDVTETSCRQGR